MAPRSSILAWRIPGAEQPGGLQSRGSQRVGSHRATNGFIFHRNTQGLGAPETALGPQDVGGWLRRPRRRWEIVASVCGLEDTEAKRLQVALALGAGPENSFLPRTTPLGPPCGVSRARRRVTIWRLQVHACQSASFVSVCDPLDCRPPASSVHGILQARTLEWVAISSSRASSPPRDRNWVSCIGRWALYCLSHQGGA